MALNRKQTRFVEVYLTGSPASDAAIQAGYSTASAKQVAWKLLQDPQVATAIEDGQRELAQATAVTAEWITQQLRDIAVAGIKGDSVKALELLGKNLGLFKERIEHSGPGGKAIPTSLQISFVRPGDVSKPD